MVGLRPQTGTAAASRTGGRIVGGRLSAGSVVSVVIDPVVALTPDLWLDSDQIAQSDGSAVSSWPDISGNARHFEQATEANKPSFQTGEVNGLPAIRFGALSRLLGNAASLNVYRNKPGCACFLVWKPGAGAGVNQTAVFLGSPTEINRRFQLFKAAQAEPGTSFAHGGRRLDADASQFAEILSMGSAWIQSVARVDTTATSVRLYLNGVLGVTNSTFQTAGNTSDTDAVVNTLGLRSNGIEPLIGDLASVIFLARNLTAAEINIIGQRNATKYGLPWTTIV